MASDTSSPPRFRPAGDDDDNAERRVHQRTDDPARPPTDDARSEASTAPPTPAGKGGRGAGKGARANDPGIGIYGKGKGRKGGKGGKGGGGRGAGKGKGKGGKGGKGEGLPIGIQASVAEDGHVVLHIMPDKTENKLLRDALSTNYALDRITFVPEAGFLVCTKKGRMTLQMARTIVAVFTDTDACPLSRQVLNSDPSLINLDAFANASYIPPTGVVAIYDDSTGFVDDNFKPLGSGVTLRMDTPEDSMPFAAELRKFTNANGGDFVRPYWKYPDDTSYEEWQLFLYEGHGVTLDMLQERMLSFALSWGLQVAPADWRQPAASGE
jgi:hypothetical protein